MRTAALLTLAALAGALGLSRLARSSTPATPLPCNALVAVEEDAGLRLVCPDDPALRGCPRVKTGRRYRGCEETGAVVGPLLAARGLRLPLSTASRDDLRALPDVGASMARKLDEARNERPLCGAADLESVPGFGPKRAAKLAEALEFDDPRCR